MKITAEWLKKYDACKDGIEYLAVKFDNDIEAIDLAKYLLSANNIDYLKWFIPRVLNRDNRIKYAVFAAELARECCKDKELLIKIDACISVANLCIAINTQENRNAAWAAGSVARAAWASGGVWTAGAAGAAGAAAWTAGAAGAAGDAWATGTAEEAAEAAEDAGAAEDKILDYGIELLEKQDES